MSVETEPFLKPIRGAGDYKRALRRAKYLMRVKDLSASENDELQLLALSLQDYEEKNFEHYEVTPNEVLESLVTDGRHTQRAVARGTGIAVSTINEIVHGKRNINAKQAVALADYFKLRVDAFLPRRA